MRPISRATRVVAAGALVVAIVATPATAVRDNSYTVHPLVSDQAGQAPIQDPKLVNAWGLAASPTGGAAWVADNGSGFSTLYLNGGTTKPDLEVAIPGGVPTGVVFNGVGGSSFVITDGFDSRPALFIFASEGGIISGWNPAVGPTVPSTIAFTAATRAGAMYTGLALGSNGVSSFLYAADFHNARVDVFDDQFRLTTLAGSFSDPALPAGYAPFGIHTIGGRIFVTYAKQDADAEDPVAGNGLGFVNMFDANGNLIARVAGRGQLNAPWGIAVVARQTSAGPAAATSSRTSATARSPLTRRCRAECSRLTVSCAAREVGHSRSTVSGRSDSETASRPARRTRSSLRPAPTPELTDSSVR